MFTISIETSIILEFQRYSALFDPQSSICSLCLCLSIYQKWSSVYVNLENDKKGLLDTSRGRKSPDGYFVGRCWAPNRNQEGPNIDPKSVQHSRKRAPSLAESILFSSCFSCGCNKQTFAIWGRLYVDLGSIWGRC